MKTNFVCEHCQTEFSTSAEADACEKRPSPKFNFKVGETIYLLPRYVWNEEKPFVKRTITNRFVWRHEAAYALDEPVQIGKAARVGYALSSESFSNFAEQFPALECDFHRRGEIVKVFNNWSTYHEFIVSVDRLGEEQV